MNRAARLFVAVLGLVTFDAQAGLGPNGLGPNGLGPNGLGPNGLGPNGLGPNGLGPNGLGPNGLGPNGLGPNGLGPNGLGPNGLGPNGLDINGLGPNGLGPNGLGPNGISAWYLVTPDGTQGPSTFKAWFEADTAAAAAYMKYFVRCAYDGKTGVAYLDATGKTWTWTGQYGFAMTSLGMMVTSETIGDIRSPMTAEEGKWVSSCLLAHVNLQGTHQYISLRGSPPNVEGQQALLPSTNERWVMGVPFGAFFADLFGGYDAAGNQVGNPGAKYACKQTGGEKDWIWKSDVVIGRNCDVENCTYADPANPLGPPLKVLTDHIGSCPIYGGSVWTTLPDGKTFIPTWASSSVDPFPYYRYDGFQYGPSDQASNYPVIFVNGPRNAPVNPFRSGGFDPDEVSAAYDVASCRGGRHSKLDWPWCTPDEAPFTVQLDHDTQRATCANGLDCFGGTSSETESYKLVKLRAGQAVDPTVRFTPILPSRSFADPSLRPDMGEAFTAIIRYQKDRTGSANISTRGSDGGWCDITTIGGGDDDKDGSSSRPACRGPAPITTVTVVNHDDDDEGSRHAREDHHRSKGPDIWAATDPGKWEWMQVYPTYLAYDTLTSTYPGKYCTADSQCAAGLTCDSMANACMKPVPPPTCNEAGCTPTACDAGLVRLTIDAPLYDGDTVSGDQCVQPCTGAGAGDCGAGQACLSGKCVNPALKIRLSGASMSESCTGAELFKGSNEQGSCGKVFKKYPLKNNTVCPRESESLPNCRGSLTWTKRKDVWGWYCRGGGEALYACLPEDAPDLDAVQFIPGKPWCAAADATSFVGVCK